MKLQDFVSDIKEIYDDHLISIVLFGSAATGEFSDKYSDFNLIVVLKSLSPSELKKASKSVKKWTKSGNPVPLFFDKNHIETSTDVFPIEFFDIKACRKVLSGTDPFENIKIDIKNLRHQCESELKGKILQLQSLYIGKADSHKETAMLMVDSLSTFISIFKGIIRLAQHEPEVKKRAIVEQLTKIIDFSPNIFMELLDIRDGSAILPRKDSDEKFEDYLEQLTIITNFVDQFEA